MGYGRRWAEPEKRSTPLPEARRRWCLFRHNQEAVRAAVARRDYVDLTTTAVEVVDEFLALMDEVGILRRLDVEGNYQRRMVAMVVLLVTYCARIIMGLSSQNQLPTHLFRDAGLLRRIGYSAKQVKEGFCRRGKGQVRPVHKNTVSDALERLAVEESQGIFEGAVEDLERAGLVRDTVFSLDGTELHTTGRYVGAGRVRSTREVRDKWGRGGTVSSSRYGYLLLSLRGVQSNTVAAAQVEKIGVSEHDRVLSLVATARRAGARVRLLLMDGAYCVGDMLWRLKHEEDVDFIVPADTTMSITEDARSLAAAGADTVLQKDLRTTAVAVRGLTTYDAYRSPQGAARRGPRATLNAVIVTRWKKEEVPQEKQTVLLTSLPVSKPLRIVRLYLKRAEMENKLHRELKQGWHIENFPGKQHGTCLAHIYLTLTLYNVACAYKTKRGRQVADRGIRRLRAEHLGGAAWKAIVFTEDEYGIFDIEEFAYLSGNQPKRFHRFRPPE